MDQADIILSDRNEAALDIHNLEISHLDKPTLVDEVTDGLEVGASVGDVGLYKLCPNFLFAFTQGEGV